VGRGEIVELDSYQFHSGPDGWQTDHDKDGLAQAAARPADTRRSTSARTIGATRVPNSSIERITSA
jgi:hypothetical protein